MMVDMRCPRCDQTFDGVGVIVMDDSPAESKTCGNCGCESVLAKTDPEEGYGDDYYYYTTDYKEPKSE